MALSMDTAIARIRDLVAEVTGIADVYAASESDANSIPDAIQSFPCALIFPGPDSGDGYVMNNGWHEHTYLVMIQILESGADVGARAKSVLPFVHRVVEKMASNVTLGGRVAYCVFERQSGFLELDYAGETYLGYEIMLEVMESAAVTPAVGS